jgi:hypothetical protein
MMATCCSARVPQSVGSTRCACRVIDVDRQKKRVTLSAKKGIIGAKTPPLIAPSEATPGARTHGWVTGITEAGVFVAMYNRLKGLVSAKDIPLPDGAALTDLYHVGQVCPCQRLRVVTLCASAAGSWWCTVATGRHPCSHSDAPLSPQRCVPCRSSSVRLWVRMAGVACG